MQDVQELEESKVGLTDLGVLGASLHLSRVRD